jgi:hypothetical protein
MFDFSRSKLYTFTRSDCRYSRSVLFAFIPPFKPLDSRIISDADQILSYENVIKILKIVYCTCTHTGVRKDDQGNYVGFTYKASVPVQVYSEHSGEGMTVLRRRATVVNSATGSWNEDETAVRKWARDHCLCPGCDGTELGKCDPCVPLTPNCDAKPPIFKCWATIAKPLGSLWAYQIQVQRVRFTESDANIVNWDIVISLIVFAVLLLLLIILAFVLKLPQDALSEIFSSNNERATLRQTGVRKRVGPW